ncbi:hypothetical protein Lalb_Chr15g0090141 [Lupinus albus]|uniref:Uncharacterized protein n=1 Tax=Lupinus albus TaxID=3870 RepID=A0A6A4PBI0_LUPAL|nr:hypothetical protein Lalb_Chr15g0090141 [Lupinus albus]
MEPCWLPQPELKFFGALCHHPKNCYTHRIQTSEIPQTQFPHLRKLVLYYSAFFLLSQFTMLQQKTLFLGAVIENERNQGEDLSY